MLTYLSPIRHLNIMGLTHPNTIVFLSLLVVLQLALNLFLYNSIQHLISILHLKWEHYTEYYRVGRQTSSIMGSIMISTITHQFSSFILYNRLYTFSINRNIIISFFFFVNHNDVITFPLLSSLKIPRIYLFSNQQVLI